MSVVKQAISALTGPVFDVIDEAVTDKDEANRLKQEIQAKVIDSKDSMAQYQMKIILAEATGESWTQRNWRPLLMLTIVAIIANNYLVGPLLSGLFGLEYPLLELPDPMWTLMTIGVGGYIGARSVEKVKGASPTQSKTSGPGLYQRVKGAIKNK